MIRPSALALALSLLLPGVARAQCALDILEEGIEAYRDLELEEAEARLRNVVAVNGRDSSPCATETARALTYLGAAQWLVDRPDSAEAAFERAVIHAPRFRPDAFEFAPDVTDLYDLVRSATPAVATSLPESVVIGPDDDERLELRLTASTEHPVEVRVDEPGEGTIRTLYTGPVATGFDGTVLAWDGRTSSGIPVRSGRYELQVVSLDDRGGPIRKVVVELTVDSDAPEPVTPSPDSAELFVSRAALEERGGVWRAIGAGAAGLVGSALIVGAPLLVNESPSGWVRYPVAGAVGVAGIVGFFRQIGGGDDEPFTRDSLDVVSPDELEDERKRLNPTLRISVGYERRVELVDPASTGPGRLDEPVSEGPPFVSAPGREQVGVDR